MKPTPPCPICGEPCSLNAGHRVNKTCGQRGCFIELRRRQSVGQIPVAANAAIRRQREERMLAVIGFYVGGSLTERDRALFAIVYKYAWLKGYHAGSKRVRRTVAA